MSRLAVGVMALAGIVASTGCVETGVYVYNDTTLPVAVTDGSCRWFSYVRLYEKSGEAVLYGKVERRERECTEDGRVEVTVLDPHGRPGSSECLPVRTAGLNEHGWDGASFRTRLKRMPEPGSRISLSFRNGGCEESPSR
jgi:hypothetical protein